MSETLIQIVDEYDNPIGSATTEEIRREGLRYRVARIMIEDTDRNILLQHRAPNMTLYPGRWDNSAAGHVDFGEEYDEAARRELEEEIGIKGIQLEQIAYYYKEAIFLGMKLNEWNVVYKGVVDNAIDLTLQPEEVSHTDWFSRAELRDLVVERPDQATHGLIMVGRVLYP